MPKKITVDMVTYHPSTDEFVLYFIEDGPWPKGDNAIGTLLARIEVKILDAADASIDGGIAAVYPNSLGKKMRIQVDSPHGCSERLDNLIRNVDKYLTESNEYSLAIKTLQFISGLRVVSGKMMGRFTKKD